MKRNRSRTALAALVGGLLALGTGLSPLETPEARAETRVGDPFAMIPMGLMAPRHRDAVAEVVRDPHFHRRGDSESFPCSPDLYLVLLNQPALTLALWQDLAQTPAWLRQVGPARFEGSDGSGATAVWEYVLRSPQLHIMLCSLTYTGPRQHIRLEGRVLLAVRSEYSKDAKSAPWIKHNVEIFVKIDSKGWKGVAKVARPIIENLLKDQIQEAGWFISLMARLIAQNPNWAIETVMKRGDLPVETRRQFNAAVTPLLKPESPKGRPTLIGALPPPASTLPAAPAPGPSSSPMRPAQVKSAAVPSTAPVRSYPGPSGLAPRVSATQPRSTSASAPANR